jgi:hypothetical protein
MSSSVYQRTARERIGIRHGQDFVVGVRLQPPRVPVAGFVCRDSLSMPLLGAPSCLTVRLGILAKQFMSSGCPCIAPIRPTDHHKVHSCTCERPVCGATVSARISARSRAPHAAK